MSEDNKLPKADDKKKQITSQSEDPIVEVDTIDEDNLDTIKTDQEEVENDVINEAEATEAIVEVEEDNSTAKEQKKPAKKEEIVTEALIENPTETLPKTKKESTKKETENALNEIDAENAKNAEDDEDPSEDDSSEDIDYQSMSLDDLASTLEKLVESEKIQSIKSKVDAIKSEFNSKFAALLAEKKAAFLEEGGNSIDFQFDSPVKKLFNRTFKTYREKRQAHYKNLEKNFKENLENRLEIIEEIKGLINVEENINTTYKHFKALQDRWKNAGPIPRDKYNNVWNNYHHHVEIFYDFLHLNRDLRDLDFKHNLEQKLKIIARAEELVEETDSNRAFRELQALHKIWKEELGPVDREQRELIWDQFSAATKAIHKKRQVYFEKIDKAYEKNLEIKNDIINQIKALTQEETNNHSIWQKRIKSIEDLREQFFKAGKVPIKVNEATWSKFKVAVRDFNHKKNSFYKGLKKDQYDNLHKKLELIKIANEHKDSTDFETTTPLMKKIQSDWKKIGHVPRKDSDKIWKQFKTACNAYFSKINNMRSEENKEEVEAFEKKSELLEKLKTVEFSDDVKANLAVINEYVATWKNMGRIPFNKRFIEGKFNKVIDAMFSKLDITKGEIELLKYDNKLESLANSDDKGLLDNEHNFLRKKIDEIRSEINQLENNLQFFANVESKNPLVKDVHKNINNHKKELDVWEGKLRKIKQLY